MKYFYYFYINRLKLNKQMRYYKTSSFYIEIINLIYFLNIKYLMEYL